MKERLKMIFDRIDIFVVCIILGCFLTIAEVFIGTWGGFAHCFIMTFLITEVCYTLRYNEKLKAIILFSVLISRRPVLLCILIFMYLIFLV